MSSRSRVEVCAEELAPLMRFGRLALCFFEVAVELLDQVLDCW